MVELPSQNQPMETGKKTLLTRTALTLGAGLLGLFIYFRGVFLSGFDRVVGGPADGRLILAIHEHWFRFFQGKERWLDLGFFYPEPNSLGASDTFLLGGLFHAAFRFAGMDAYLAFQWVQLLLAITGFAGMLIWLRRYRRIDYGVAVFGAFLFLIASPVVLAVRNSHVQLQAVWLVPWLAILLESVWHDLHHRPRRLLLSFTAFCGLYGLFAYSTFYMAWFFLLFLIIWGLAALLLGGFRNGLRVLGEGFRQWRCLLPGIGLATGFLILFLVTYLPLRLEHGGRTLGAAIKSLPAPWDFINHSGTNLLWGRIFENLHDYHRYLFWELELGPTLLFTVVVVAFSLTSLFRPAIVEREQRMYARITALALLISFLLLVRVGMVSLWAVPYFLVPGADGLRAVFRFSVFLVVPGILLLSLCLQYLRAHAVGRVSRILVFLLFGLIALEQGQVVETARIRRDIDLAILAQLPDPPEDATAFYTVGPPLNDHESIVLVAGGIRFAQHWDLPTVGGYSGVFPKDWDLLVPTISASYNKLIDWCLREGVHGAVYFFDGYRLEWGRAVRNPVSYGELLGKDLTTLVPEAFSSLVVKGWSDPEWWGVWSQSPQAVLRIPPFAALRGKPALLELTFNGYLQPGHAWQRVEILLNGETVFTDALAIDGPDRTIRLELTPAQTLQDIRLEFRLPDAVSPRDLGISEDARELAVGLKGLAVHPL